MSNSTHFHHQVLDYLRQYSQACDLRHLKALAWMVSALICSGQLSLPAWEPYVPSRAQKAQSVERRKAAIYAQCSDSGRAAVCAISVGKFKRMESAPPVPGNGHDGVMGSLLHDSPVRGLNRTGSAVVVASARTRQCNGSLQGIQGAVTKSQMAVAPSPGCHAAGRSWRKPIMS